MASTKEEKEIEVSHSVLFNSYKTENLLTSIFFLTRSPLLLSQNRPNTNLNLKYFIHFSGGQNK